MEARVHNDLIDRVHQAEEIDSPRRSPQAPLKSSCGSTPLGQLNSLTNDPSISLPSSSVATSVATRLLHGCPLSLHQTQGSSFLLRVGCPHSPGFSRLAKR